MSRKRDVLSLSGGRLLTEVKYVVVTRARKNEDRVPMCSATPGTAHAMIVLR